MYDLVILENCLTSEAFNKEIEINLLVIIFLSFSFFISGKYVLGASLLELNSAFDRHNVGDVELGYCRLQLSRLL